MKHRIRDGLLPSVASLILMAIASLFIQCSTGKENGGFPDKKIFSDPPANYRSNAGLGMQLDKVTEESAREQIRYYFKRGFGGVFIEATSGNKGSLPEWYVEQGKPFMNLGDTGIEYLDDDFIRVYRTYLDEAEKLGMQVILYDDYHFPTGQVAGRFFQQFPEHMAARLDKVEKDFIGAGNLQLQVPEGTWLGAALWNLDNNETTDVSDGFADGVVRCKVVEGKWKLMAFYLDHKAVLKLRNPGIMNYIEKEAVEKFLTISYDKFYKGFGEYFGTVIPMSFYDEPSMHWMDGRMWSATLNDRYKEKFGESPVKYYPALWYEMGENTPAIRNAILGVRAEMYEVNFVKQMADWCDAHRIRLSGHMDQEERPNPVMSNGDLMKVFQYQQIPGTDDVFYWGRMNPGYKIVTSASYNYDKPVTWAETYAAYQEFDKGIAYKAAMDQYAMGVNMQNSFPQKLEESMSVDELVEFNGYIGRLSYMLQGGMHISDVAVLYPIASAQAYNTFGEGWEYGYVGGSMPTEFDYLEVGEDLFRRLRIDFTYLHPDVLVGNCLIEDKHLILDNKVNRESYRVLIIPGGNTIQASVAAKIAEFFRKGGKVIATSKLPVYSAEFGKDELVRAAIKEVFGFRPEESEEQNSTGGNPYSENVSETGGRAFFIPVPGTKIWNEVLGKCLPVRDVAFAEPEWNTGRLSVYKPSLKLDSREWIEMQRPDYSGALTYTHKVKGGKDIYFISNSSEKHLKTEVTLRGKKRLERWDPLTGQCLELEASATSVNGLECTIFSLALPAARSIFIVAESL